MFNFNLFVLFNWNDTLTAQKYFIEHEMNELYLISCSVKYQLQLYY